MQPDRGCDRAAQQLELVAVGDEQVGRREADPKHREVTVTEPVQSAQEPQVRRFVGVAERVGAARPAELRALDVELPGERVDDVEEQLARIVRLQVRREAVEDRAGARRRAHVDCTASVTLTARTQGSWSSPGWISLFVAVIRSPSSRNSAV